MTLLVCIMCICEVLCSVQSLLNISVDQYQGKKNMLFKTLIVAVFKEWRSASGDDEHLERVCVD